MRRSCLILGGVPLGLVLIGFVYLTINPPYSEPDTGYLSRSTELDARLDPSHPTAAFEVRFGASENVYAGAYGGFPPLRMSATLVGESAESANARLWLFPRDGVPVTHLATSEDGGQLNWQLDCQTPGGRSGCARTAILIVAGADLPADGLTTKVRLLAEQRFPAHRPTPFLVSLDLSAESVELAVDDRLMAGGADGSHRLSPQLPIVRWALHADDTEAQVDGSWLTVEVEHRGVAIPTGFEAPPPVAVAVVDQAGKVVVIAEVRPGSPSMLALPPLAGEHTVVAWWQDRAAESYDVRWRLEQRVIGADSAPHLSALRAQEVAPVAQVENSGDLVTDESGREVPIGFGRFVSGSTPYLGPDHLPSHLATVQLHLVVQTDDATPVVLRLNGAPVAFVAGATVDFAFGEAVSCSDVCGSGVSVATDYRQPPVKVAWDGVATLWPLDPAMDQQR
ncbi:MAG: hypothetical protein ACRDFR_07030 [Candidatus Limnocylindria bacterium]